MKMMPMKMMYPQLLSILPPKLRQTAAEQPCSALLEIRLREGRDMTLVSTSGYVRTHARVSQEDLSFCVNAACRYSPWNAEGVSRGYLTAPGGHRIGLCGVYRAGKLQQLHSLCIRVARDCPGISQGIPVEESILILGPPGSGKTTLLRDFVRRLSEQNAVSVVDEREELFPRSEGESCFDPGPNTDVLLGCEKPKGIDMVLRAMGPAWIAVDEITGEADCAALARTLRCGVKVAATAHAESAADLRERAIYSPLIRSGVFRRCVVLDRSRRWHLEEICR